MKVIQAKTAKGSLTNCIYIEEDNGDINCFSYGQLVARIKNGKYEELSGPKFYSNTSCRHKAQFRRIYGVTR